MAPNFGIALAKHSYGCSLKLEGDFDATSAYELIYAIKKLPEDRKISISTDGLQNIHQFGLDVFHRLMGALNGQSARIGFTGKHASRLSLGNPSRPS
jgi:hypothetical protein